MAVTFARLGNGDWRTMRSVAQTVTGVAMENVVKAKAGDCWRPKSKIAWFQGDLARIDEAYEALRHAGYHVDEFQRHPHGWDKVPKPCGTAEDRTMKTLLRDLEESRARPSGLPVAELFKKYGIDAEDGLNSRLVDKIEKVVSFHDL